MEELSRCNNVEEYKNIYSVIIHNEEFITGVGGKRSQCKRMKMTSDDSTEALKNMVYKKLDAYLYNMMQENKNFIGST